MGLSSSSVLSRLIGEAGITMRVGEGLSSVS